MTAPDYPHEAVRVAVLALQGYPWPDGEVTEEQIARLVLDAAVPVLNETVALAALASMGALGPMSPIQAVHLDGDPES